MIAAKCKPKFDLSQMGEADRHNLFSTFLDSVQRFYDDPANRERFEAWQAEKRLTRKNENKV